MSNNTPKIIGYGLIMQSTGNLTGPFLHMDDACHDKLEDALSEAYGLRDERLMGIFSIDSEGNFSTEFNKRKLSDVLDEMERDNMTEGEGADQRVIDSHNFRHATTL